MTWKEFKDLIDTRLQALGADDNTTLRDVEVFDPVDFLIEVEITEGGIVIST